MTFLISVYEKFPDVIGGSDYSDLTLWYADRWTVLHQGVIARFVTYPAFLIQADIRAYTLITATVLYIALIGLLVTLCRICTEEGVDTDRILTLLAISPSFISFAYYNIDLISALFASLSILLLLRQRELESAISMGFAVASKVFPGIFLPFFLRAITTWRKRAVYLAAAFATWLVLNAYFMISSWSDWILLLKIQGEWGIEDSWMIFILPQMSPFSHMLFYGLFGLLLIHVYVNSRRLSLPQQCLAALLAFVVTSYKFAPQYYLELLPLIVLTPLFKPPLAYIPDLLNAAIIMTWFTPWLNSGYPLSPSSPTQWIAALRQLILFIYLLALLHPEKFRHLKSTIPI
jgi:uncharacterized membrane protein